MNSPELKAYMNGGVRGQALATAHSLASFRVLDLPHEPVSLAGQGVDAMRAGNQQQLGEYVQRLVEAQETNRSTLRGLLWAHRTLMRVWDEDASDIEAEQGVALVWGFLAQEWQCTEPPAAELVEQYLHRRFLNNHPAMEALALGSEGQS